MTIRILQYSFTGNTRATCATITKALGGACDAITAPAPRKGKWAIFLLGFRSVFGFGPKIIAPEQDWAGADLLILAAPVWAGRVALPMRQWLAQGHVLPVRVALVVTSGAPELPDGFFDTFAQHTRRTPIATLHISEDDRETGADADKIAEFTKACAKAVTPPSASPAPAQAQGT